MANTQHTMYSLILLLILVSAAVSHKCVRLKQQNITISSTRTMQYARSTSNKKFRIHLEYTAKIQSLPDYETIKTKFIEPAAQFWSKALSAKYPSGGPLLFDRPCTGGVYERATEDGTTYYNYCTQGCVPEVSCYVQKLPEKYLGPCREMVNGRPRTTKAAGSGVPNADFVLIVDGSPISVCSGGVLGVSTGCQISSEKNQPILSYINMCPDANHKYPYSERYFGVVVHEMAHSLGFSSNLFAFMHDENGNPRTPRDPITNQPNLGMDDHIYIPSPSTVDTVQREWHSAVGTYNYQIKVLKTPQIVAAARAHFNCPTLDGVDLENEGEGGTAATHLEKRLVYDELMAGSIDQRAYTSKLTLAFFQDSGWYTVDYSMAENWKWGKNLGCDFAQRNCYEYMEINRAKGQPIGPWCADPQSNNTQCLIYENAYGTCDLWKFDTLRSEDQQYFTELPGIPQKMVPYYGGRTFLMDGCPFVKPLASSSGKLSGYCTDKENTVALRETENMELQYFNADSMCFNHGNAWESTSCNKPYNFETPRASCHQYTCSNKHGLIIHVANKEFQCPLAGGTLSVGTVGTYHYVTGTVVCPSCSEICTSCPEYPLPLKSVPDPKPAVMPCPMGRD